MPTLYTALLDLLYETRNEHLPLNIGGGYGIYLKQEHIRLNIDGTTSNGSQFDAKLYLPHPLTFTMMKLFAFRDRIEDTNKDFDSYHALDIYTILATTSEAEWDRALGFCEVHRTDPRILEASQIAEHYFSSMTSKGMLQMRESPYCRPELQLKDFCDTIRELFSPLTREGR